MIFLLFKTRFNIVVFLLWGRDPVLELQIAAICASCCTSIALCNSVSADRSGVAASTFLAAALASVILLCSAPESHDSHCNGCMKVANGALAADLFHFGILMIFLLKFLLKRASISSFIRFWRRDPVLELQIAAICGAVVYCVLHLKVVSRIVMVPSKLRSTGKYFVQTL